MITIHNLHSEKPSKPYDFKIDRSSPLGNPFLMKNSSGIERDRVCDAFFCKFVELMNFSEINGTEKERQVYLNYLNEMIEVHKKYGKLRLFCWCAPLRCHGITIKNYLEQRLSI